MIKFHDREDAGQQLAEKLAAYRNAKDTIILALPRGGVPVAAVVAKQLHLPLDIFLVRKLGVPTYPELAMGAIAENGALLFNEDVIRNFHVSQAAIELVINAEKKELARRMTQYRGARQLPSLNNQTVMLIDDGLATGATMRAAITGVHTAHPKAIIVAVPTAAQDSFQAIQAMPTVTEAIGIIVTEDFGNVGHFYKNFDQTTDETVRKLISPE